jgi:hypothetical protein
MKFTTAKGQKLHAKVAVGKRLASRSMHQKYGVTAVTRLLSPRGDRKEMHSSAQNWLRHVSVHT